jgi:hypothetical protein
MYWVGPSNAAAAQFGNYWNLDIADASDDQLVCGLPLLPGSDIMAQHPEIGFPGPLWMAVDGNQEIVPGFDDFGVRARLYFIVPQATRHVTRY